MKNLKTLTHSDVSNRIEEFTGSPLVPRLNMALMASADAPANAALKQFLVDPPVNPKALAGKRIAIVSTDGVEEIELTAPLKWLRERGATVDVIAPKFAPPPNFGAQVPSVRETHILTARFLENSSWVKIDGFLGETKPSDYDAAIVPGGAWNPDFLRMNPVALSFLQEVAQQAKPVAAICHGPVVLIDAGLVRGKKVTGFTSILTDLENAGAEVVKDESVVVSENIITSRTPLDLPNFMNAIAKALGCHNV